MSLVTLLQLVIGATVLVSLFITLGELMASSPNSAVDDSEDSLSAIFDNVSNPVVQIVSVTPPLFSLNPQAQNATEVGAGFIYDDRGHMVTANQVLAGANNVSVVFKGGDRYDAYVVGRDAFTDTAVLKLVNNDNTVAEEAFRLTKPVTLGNSSA